LEKLTNVSIEYDVKVNQHSNSIVLIIALHALHARAVEVLTAV